jgi:PaaA2-like antitoxin
MTTETIDHITLSKLAEAGVVRSAHVVGQAGGWGVLVKYGMTERALASRRQQVRIFRRLETLVEYLKGIGIPRFDVDAVNYDPEGENVYTRPDLSSSMKKAHEAAAYDKWLKEQVQEAIDDPRPSVPNEEVKKHFAGRREALRKRIAAEKS